jgi:hypothetical protein
MMLNHWFLDASREEDEDFKGREEGRHQGKIEE